MSRLSSAIKKEILHLVRDIPGMVILFVMPVLLVFIVTLAQDTAVNRENRLDLAVVDRSGSALAAAVVRDLDSSAMFRVTVSGDPSAKAVSDARIVVTILPGDSAVTVTMDPSIGGAYKSSLYSSVSFIIRGAEAKQAMERTLSLFFRPSDTLMKSMVRNTLNESMAKMPPVTMESTVVSADGIRPSILQNNIPGFILFAMFFIVIPLSGSMITEKNEGAFMRLRVLPVSRATLLFSKVLVYGVVCLLQFALMILMGRFVFPAVAGMPALDMGGDWLSILVITLAAAMAATGFGILMGAAARTVAQAALFGSVLVVLLGMISGTFLPVYLLPAWVQAISHLSPIRWGMDAYLKVIVLGKGLRAVLPSILALLLFFSLAMTFSISIFARKK